MSLKSFIFSAALAATFATASVADELRDLATAYVKLEANQIMFSDMFSAETFASQFASTLPAEMTSDADKLLEAGQLMSDRMTPLIPLIEQATIDASVRHFTLEELQALYDFYDSELGASILRKTSIYFAEAMAELNPEIMAVSQEMTPEIVEILTSE